MNSQWDIGDTVRVVRNVRNDGTFAGTTIGELLVRCGKVGTVIDVGTFLIDQIIYTVHFLDIDRIVGCREEELIGAEDAWLPSAFGNRDRVAAGKSLVLAAETQVQIGSIGEILRVMRNGDTPVYHVHFDCLPGRVLAVPESALKPLETM